MCKLQKKTNVNMTDFESMMHVCTNSQFSAYLTNKYEHKYHLNVRTFRIWYVLGAFGICGLSYVSYQNNIIFLVMWVSLFSFFFSFFLSFFLYFFRFIFFLVPHQRDFTNVIRLFRHTNITTRIKKPTTTNQPQKNETQFKQLFSLF